MATILVFISLNPLRNPLKLFSRTWRAKLTAVFVTEVTGIDTPQHKMPRNSHSSRARSGSMSSVESFEPRDNDSDYVPSDTEHNDDADWDAADLVDDSPAACAQRRAQYIAAAVAKKAAVAKPAAKPAARAAAPASSRRSARIAGRS